MSPVKNEHQHIEKKMLASLRKISKQAMDIPPLPERIGRGILHVFGEQDAMERLANYSAIWLQEREGTQSELSELVEALNSISKILSTIPDSMIAKALSFFYWIIGYQPSDQQLIQKLQRRMTAWRIKRISPAQGTRFNPKLQMGVAVVETDNWDLDMTIARVDDEGIALGNTLLSKPLVSVYRCFSPFPVSQANTKEHTNV